MNNFISIGSCLSYLIGNFYKDFTQANFLSSTRHNRIDRIVDVYLEKNKPELSYSYLSKFKFQKDSSLDLKQQIDNQFSSRSLGKTYLRSDTAIGLTDIIENPNNINLIIYDTFGDLLFKLLLSKKDKATFFFNTKYSDNWQEYFEMEQDRISIEAIISYYIKLIKYFHKKNQNIKIIFVNFPLLHHHDCLIRDRVEKLNYAFQQNIFLQNNSFFIPATNIPFEYLDQTDKNHFLTYRGRSIYEDYSVVIKAILDLNFSPYEWNRNHIFKENLKNTEKFFLDTIKMQICQQFKQFAEFKYWKVKKINKGNISNINYRQYYTEDFDLSLDIYKNKRLLDIGCGPCGSLEWANTSQERIGLDPLADEYLQLGADKHKMKYVKGKSEKIPFENEYFDIVAILNSLAYLDDLNTAILEIKRVLKPGGLLILLTDFNNQVDSRKTIKITQDITQKFSPELILIDKKHYQIKNNKIYSSFKQKQPYENANNSTHPGLLAAKFCKLSK